MSSSLTAGLPSRGGRETPASEYPRGTSREGELRKNDQRDGGFVVSFISWRETVPGISPVPEAVAAKTVARKGHDEWQRSDAAKRRDGSAASRKGEGGGGVGEPRATTENSGGGSDDQREVAVDETRGVRLVVV
eukprot:CAMPEP_0113589614 /NCGR_PEP_ID=MMETSP0015_2-20120614/36187_1 /TAXON_ID=2838 /ORGANISM="Odontella" /LENGTH=133 /DNA_ID=CAMNT_0000495655 /DNA_START=483 /DNA_END=885 /DNA_ORIENTATION=+ /assembly_acc=CAM_ASM_000160